VVAPRQETERGGANVSDVPQTFVGYTWGSFQARRDLLHRRTVMTNTTVMPKIRDFIHSRFEPFVMIFPAGRFPGRLLALVPHT
jgi:hypothetical protein